MRHLKPREIQGCQLALDASIATSLYDATSGGSLVAADGVVKRWEDQSGNGYNVTEATNGPRRKVATMNGRDTLYFDGTNDKLTQSAASQSKFLHVSAGSTFAYVAHYGTSSNPDALLMVAGSNGVSSAKIGAGFGYDDRSASSLSNCSVTIIYSGTGGSDPPVLSRVTDKIAPNTPQAGITLVDPANATAALRDQTSINGDPDESGNTQTRTPSTADPTHALQIGAGGNANFFMLGYISKVAAWNVQLNSAVRRRINHADMRKWRING